MLYPWAIPGAVVVCVKDTPWRKFGDRPDMPGQQFPQFMQQYTIRGVTTIWGGRLPALMFKEFRGKWSINCFRPLEKVEDEIEVSARKPVPVDG